MYLEGNAGFRAHFPALFEPVPDGVQNVEEREADEGRPEEKEDERDVGVSVEIQIGRKLREMGDQFQQEHLQLVRVISDHTILTADVNQMGERVAQVCDSRWFHCSGFCHTVQ